MNRFQNLLIASALMFITFFTGVKADNFEFYPGEEITALQDSLYHFSVEDSAFLHPGKYFCGELGSAGLVLANSAILICRGSAGSCTLTALSANLLDTAGSVITGYFDSTATGTGLLQGFTICDGTGPNGGGILAYNGCPRIDSCSIVNNHADSSAGGMLLVNCEARISNSTISNNSSFSGGGICAYSSLVELENCEITYNFGENGGGFILVNSTCQFFKTRLQFNNGLHGAGGLLVNTDGIIDSCLVYGNRATNGAGFMITGCMEYGLRITNSIIDSNSGYEGGGFFIDSSEVIIDHCILTRNSGVGYGGVLFINNAAPLIEHNSLIDNDCSGDGAGIFMFRSAPIIRKNRLENNIAHGYGGALYIYGNSSPLIRENLISNNSVSYGACIYVEYQSTPVLIKNTMVNNVARMGGAIAICEASKAFIDSCFFTDNGSLENDVSGLAGVVMNSDTISITNSNIYYNTFQDDREISNAAPIYMPFTHNFWWTTDSLEVRNMIEGRGVIQPLMSDFIPGVPGEPLAIDSIRNYDRYLITIKREIDYLDDTLYLKAYGEDRTPELAEAAIVIIRSGGCPEGIAIALAETDTNSGIFQGKATIKLATGMDTLRLDDIRQVIRLDPEGDTIVIKGNIPNSDTFVVCYTPVGIFEGNKSNPKEMEISIYPNPFNASCNIAVPMGSIARIYDINGRVVKEVFPGTKLSANDKALFNHPINQNEFAWKPGPDLHSGVYFLQVNKDQNILSSKIIFLK
ncbi:T9SS type A sorting domain-containing protein [bacterium]|nr:T9SS type A sorting domain-containing protein [bacterium]